MTQPKPRIVLYGTGQFGGFITRFAVEALFNRIPDVIAAPPGIQELYKLGPLHHTALIHAG